MTAQDAFAKWKDGAHLSDLASELGWRRSKLRRQLIRMAGGKEKFRAMRADGAGGQTELFGGKRASPGAFAAPDDSKVPVISRALLKNGWKLERIYPKGLATDVHVSPEGVRYVAASTREKADLIYASKTKGVPPVRFRKLEGSAAEKRAKQHDRLLKQGEQLLEKTTERRRVKRVRRKR